MLPSTAPTTTELTLRLNPGPEAIPAARRALDGLTDLVERPVQENLRLLVTELVTNGVRYGSDRGPVGVTVTLEEDCVRVEVTDCGRGFSPPEAPMPREDGTGGWGLQLVDRVADAWGVRVGDHTCVWFELAR
ncbi:MAG TPA: ATP-binding protein [Thermoleophilaceae bacterium]|nr:ATP-binding protein [Thermoleophilaceae bacterium]